MSGQPPKIKIEIDKSELDALRQEIQEILSQAKTSVTAPVSIKQGKGWEFFEDYTFKSMKPLEEQKRTARLVLSNLTKIDEMDKYLRLGYLDRATRAIMTRIPIIREALPLVYKTRMILSADPTIALILTGIYTLEAFLTMQDRFRREFESYYEMLRLARPNWDGQHIEEYIRQHENNLLKKLIPH